MQRLLARAWAYYRDTGLIVKMTVAFVLGLVTAMVFRQDAKIVSAPGDILLNLLQMIVIPIIMLTLVDAINNTRAGRIARIIPKVFVYYIVTTVAALLISLVIALLVNPGTGLRRPGSHPKTPKTPSFLDQLLGIVPENIFKALADGKILPLIFISLIIGVTLARMSHSDDEKISELAATLQKLVAAAKEITFRILGGILQYAPIGVFCLVASEIGGQGFDALASLGELAAVVYVALAAQILLVYIPLLRLYRVRVRQFFINCREPMATAFTTQSSSGTIPVSLKSARSAGLLDDVSGLVIPLGATVNMDGAVIRLGASVVLAANIAGKDMSIGELAGIVVTATLVSIGTAGVPGAGLIGLTILLKHAGLPLDIVALVSGIDVVLGMGATMLNVTGDLTVAHLIDRGERRALSRAGGQAP